MKRLLLKILLLLSITNLVFAANPSQGGLYIDGTRVEYTSSNIIGSVTPGQIIPACKQFYEQGSLWVNYTMRDKVIPGTITETDLIDQGFIKFNPTLINSKVDINISGDYIIGGSLLYQFRPILKQGNYEIYVSAETSLAKQNGSVGMKIEVDGREIDGSIKQDVIAGVPLTLQVYVPEITLDYCDVVRIRAISYTSTIEHIDSVRIWLRIVDRD